MAKRLLPVMMCLIMALSGNSASGWSYHTHRRLTADAIRLMPEDFRNQFAAQKASFLKGATDPDTLIKDFTNHVYHSDGSMVDGLYRIKDLFRTAAEMIRTGAEPGQTAYILGLMSHYIADLNQPLHTAGSERNPDESEFHIRYERDLNPHLKNLALPSLACRPVYDIEQRVKEMTAAAYREYGAIETAYTAGRGLPEVMALSERQLAAATTSIVDFWLGVFTEAGRPMSLAGAGAGSVSEAGEELQIENSAVANSDWININTASAAEIARFFNIELPKAQRLVDARPFNSAYDLAKVQGFTAYFVKRHHDRIRLK